MVDSKVSIIIPFYNASSSLFVSLESVLSQSHKFIEVILIDDCSTDNSLEIVKGFEMLFLEKGFEFTLCEHKINQGVAVARNTGLGKATGDFVYFVDADDWIEPDTIGSLLIMASKSSAEIVGCNWYLSFKSNERKMNQPHFETPWEAIYLILCGRMRWNLWIFMVRRELFTKNVISFVPDKNMGEDLLVMLKLFIKAEKVSFIDRRLYHYNQQNENSLTKEYSDKYIQDVTFNVFEAEKELLRSKYKSRIKNEIFY